MRTLARLAEPDRGRGRGRGVAWWAGRAVRVRVRVHGAAGRDVQVRRDVLR